MTVGVIAHIENPGFDEVRQLARTAEQAGADWLGVADAFWWRDTWLLLAEAARATARIRLGPLVTNPYLRHPFVTVSALASLQDLAGPRVFAGLGAGGSEIRLAAKISRADAPVRIERLASLIRSVASGAPLDLSSGRRLDLPLLPVPIIVGARSSGVLRSAGAWLTMSCYGLSPKATWTARWPQSIRVTTPFRLRPVKVGASK